MQLSNMKCKVCEGDVQAFTKMEAKEYLLKVKDWELVEGGQLKVRKNFQFRDFVEAMAFVNRVADIAEKEKHHPDIAIHYHRVTILLWTHAVKGLTENDFILAAKMDVLC